MCSIFSRYYPSPIYRYIIILSIASLIFIIINIVYILTRSVVGHLQLKKYKQQITISVILILSVLALIIFAERTSDKGPKGNLVNIEPIKDLDYYVLVINSEDSNMIYDTSGNQILKTDSVAFFKNGESISHGRKQLNMLNRRNGIKWNLSLDVHHEFIASDDGTIWTITRTNYTYVNRDILFDILIRFDSNGTELWRWDSYDHLEELQKLHYKSSYDTSGETSEPTNRLGMHDYYHINSIDIIKENKNSYDKRFQKGNIIVSLPKADLVIILDKDTYDIVWSWGIDDLDFMHTPRMHQNGNIFIFDNNARDIHSRVLAVDPIKKEIVWEYKGEYPNSFYSIRTGSVEPLQNGNLLITDSSNGCFFELTLDKKIVWKVCNQERDDIDGRTIWIYRASYLDKKTIDELIPTCCKEVMVPKYSYKYVDYISDQ